MKPPTLTPHQSTAFNQITNFLSHPTPIKIFVLSGYAGTGKTTLLSHLDPTNLAFCSPTGKAASVLNSKGLRATTIHRLIYEAIPNTKPIRFRKRNSLPKSIHAIVVDEASMLNTETLRDLRSFNLPLLLVGDSFQLPPIGSDPAIFTTFPSASLTEVHRQALDNPIISLATHLRSSSTSTLRNWCPPNKGQGDCSVRILPRGGVKIDPTDVDQVIVGFNKTRLSVNAAIRRRLGRTSIRPQKGDRLMVLKNNYDYGFVNGQQVFADENASSWDNQLTIMDEDGTAHDVEFLPEVFDRNDETNVKSCPPTHVPLTYAYAITCHKAQGSEWNHVAVIDEAFGKGDEPQRWRYTAVTRAKERLTIFC